MANVQEKKEEKRIGELENQLAKALSYIRSLTKLHASPWNPDAAVTQLLDVATEAGAALADITSPDEGGIQLLPCPTCGANVFSSLDCTCGSDPAGRCIVHPHL